MSESSVDLVSTLRSASHSPTALLEELKKLFMSNVNYADAAMFSAAAALNDEGLPIIERIAQMLAEGLPFQEISLFALPILHHCQRVEPSTLVHLIDAVCSRSPQNVMYLGPEISQIFSRDTKLGYTCLEQAITASTAQLETATVLAIATASSDRESSIPYFLTLAREEREHCFHVALQALAIHDGDTLAASQSTGELRDIFERAKDDGQCALHGYTLLCNLASFDATSLARLRECIEVDMPHAFIATARWLRFLAGKELAPHIADLARVVSHASSGRQEYLNELNETLSCYLYRLANRRLAYEMLDIVSAYGLWSFTGIGSGVFNAIVTTPESLKYVLSHWLLSDTFRQEPLRKLLVEGIPLHSVVSPDVTAFFNASDRARVRAVHRLLGLCHSAKLIANMLFELALDSENGVWAQEVFLNVTGSRLAAEFTGETKEFLQAKVSTIPRGKFKRSVSALLKEMLEWESFLRNLPTLPELTPSREKQMTLRLARQRRDAEISKRVERKSIFSSIASQSYIKQGNQFAIRMPDGKTTVTQMHTLTVSFELPSSEVLNPLAALIERTLLLADGEQ